MTRQKHPLAQTTYEELINMMNYDNEIEKEFWDKRQLVK